MLYKKRGGLNMIDVDLFYKSKQINVYRIIQNYTFTKRRLECNGKH